MENLETITLGTFTAYIHNDEHAESPREWDNLGTMIFRGTYSHLGDKHEVDFSECTRYSDDVKAIQKVYGSDCIMLTVYGYSHGGLTISTSPFYCKWDSGILGHVVVSRKTIREEWSIKRITEKTKQKMIEILKGEVETLNQYVMGDVYGYTIIDESANGEDEGDKDSCWGFYGIDSVKDEVKMMLEYYHKEQLKHEGEQQELKLSA